MQQFIDRKSEPEALRNAFESDKAELITIYGRRRVGKTSLVLKSVEGFEHLYFLADERSEGENLSEFRKKVSEFLGDDVIARSDLDWVELFRIIAR